MDIKTLAIVASILVGYYLGKKSINSLVKRIGAERNITSSRVHYVNAVLVLVWTAACFIGVGMSIDIGYHDLGLFFGSVFAVVGVALFAQWSILSNVTASIIVFFFFPYRVGNDVEILDGDNTVRGKIKEITLFHVILREQNGTLVTFPNAMAFQRPVKIRPEQLASRQKIDEQGGNTQEGHETRDIGHGG